MNQFLQQRYAQRPKGSASLGALGGGLIGGGAGAGLGALFSKLTGMGGHLPMAIGMGAGGLLGMGLGAAPALNANKQFQKDNVMLFNQLDPNSQYQAMQAWADEMDSAVGDGSFNQMLQTNPEQFKQLMLQIL